MSEHATLGGLRLIDWIAVALILGVIAALLIPGGPPAREPARRTACLNNLRTISLALDQYAQVQGEYPGYRFPLTTAAPQSLTYAVSFVVPLLPYLGQQELYRKFQAGVAASDGEAEILAPEGTAEQLLPPEQREFLDLLLCPSDPPPRRDGAPLSYVVNSGLPDVVLPLGPTGELAPFPRDWAANGGFFDQFPDAALGAGPESVNASQQVVRLTKAAITAADGQAHTLMLSENVDAGDYTDARSGIYTHYPPGVATERNLCFLWHDRVNAAGRLDPPPEARINALVGDGTPTNLNFARPSSYHPGTVNVSFFDCSARTVSERIDYHVYCLLMTPDGGQSRPSGSVANWPRDSTEDILFRRTPVDEDDLP